MPEALQVLCLALVIVAGSWLLGALVIWAGEFRR